MTVEEGVAGVKAQFEGGNITASGATNVLALYDPDTNGGQAAVKGIDAVPFPGDTAGGDDNFGTVVVGSMTVDKTGRYTFFVQADDNASFGIQGAEFDTTAGDDRTEVISLGEFSHCVGDFNSGNINAICHIDLEEGEYEFEGYQREQGGGAFYQVWFQEGEHTALSTAAASPLATDPDGTLIPANQGIGLVGGGGGADCDFDGNGTCDIVDLDQLMDALGSNNADFDLDNSGTVDAIDRNQWLSEAGIKEKGAAYVVGDADLDGDVDTSDLNSVGVNWQRTDVATYANGDFDGDMDVDSTDLNFVGVNWQHGVPARAAVPEPTGAMLSLVGLLGLLSLRRRR